MMLIFVIIAIILAMMIFYAKSRDGRYSTDEFGVYLDGRGNYRYIPKDTGALAREFGIAKRVYFAENNRGESVIKDLESGKILVNCDMERAKKNEEEAERQGLKYFIRCENENCNLGTHEYENAKGVRYCKVGSSWEEYGNIDENGKLIKGRYFVKRAIRYSNEELGIRNYRGMFYYKTGSDQMFTDPDEDTIIQNNRLFGKEKARIIEKAIIDDANKQIDGYKNEYGLYDWFAFQPQRNMEFNVNTTWSHSAMSQTIRNW